MKLLIPDIKGEANVVYETGLYYPHHNLYYIVSSEWDLRALQAVLRSGIARLFVGVYSTQMRGGYLRYQAQYLRRIRLPKWNDVPKDIQDKLKEAARRGDSEESNRVTFDLYGLNTEERAALSTADTLLLSLRAGIETGEYSDLSEMTSIRTYFAGFAARVAVEAARC